MTTLLGPTPPQSASHVEVRSRCPSGDQPAIAPQPAASHVPSETPIRDIPITGDGRNWYINVPQPPRQYRTDIGYISRRGDFFVLARSTPGSTLP